MELKSLDFRSDTGLNAPHPLSNFSSVDLIIKDSVNAIGFQVAFYYGLAGFARAWQYRKQVLRSVHNLVFFTLWLTGSAAFLFFIAAYSIPTFNLTTNIVGLGGIAIGVVPLLLNRQRWQGSRGGK